MLKCIVTFSDAHFIGILAVYGIINEYLFTIISLGRQQYHLEVFTKPCNSMHSFTMFSSTPTFAKSHCLCDKVYHKQEVRFLLYIVGQIVTWQYIPKPLDHDWPCSVINDHDWQLWNCPYASVTRLFFPTDSLYFNCPLLYISRLFSTGRSCGSCGRTIGAGELVMKAGNAAYHVKCFTCATCRQQLMTGDRYSIVNGAILCEQDSAQESKGQW